MDSSTALLLILGMGAVTYIPRMLPFVLLKDKPIPPFIQAVLRNIPYATLGALIFPAIILLREGDILFGLVALTVSAAIAFTGASVVLTVIGAILIVSLYSYIF